MSSARKKPPAAAELAATPAAVPVTPKRGRGRPRNDPGTNAERVVGVRLTTEAYDRLAAQAAAAGTTMSEILRCAWDAAHGDE
jgi:uncharacterized protein (DUF4415 family)